MADISLPLADVSRRAEVQVSPGVLCPVAIQTLARIMTLRLPSLIFLDAKQSFMYPFSLNLNHSWVLYPVLRTLPPSTPPHFPLCLVYED